MTDNNLQKKVAELEAEIRRLKKNNLGLVFEDKPEDVVEQAKTKGLSEKPPQTPSFPVKYRHESTKFSLDCASEKAPLRTVPG